MFAHCGQSETNNPCSQAPAWEQGKAPAWEQGINLAIVLAGTILLTAAAEVSAQGFGTDGRYFPLNQHTPPGVAGSWVGIAGRSNPGYFQLIRIDLPSDGQVTFYDQSASRPVSLPAPAQIGVAIGQTYRLHISNMPEFPGIELYPSIEILDRLHPPAGISKKFPIPVELTREEIEFALAGRLITKVIYLEQPQRALVYRSNQPADAGRSSKQSADAGRLPVLTLPSSRNLLAEADRMGRPMIILRLGGRLPNVRGNDPAFFGSGAPVRRLDNGQPPKSSSTSTLRRSQ